MFPLASPPSVQALGSLPRVSLTARVTQQSGTNTDKAPPASNPNGHADALPVEKRQEEVDGAGVDGQKEAAAWVVEAHVQRTRPWQPHSLRAYTPAFSKVSFDCANCDRHKFMVHVSHTGGSVHSCARPVSNMSLHLNAQAAYSLSLPFCAIHPSVHPLSPRMRAGG